MFDTGITFSLEGPFDMMEYILASKQVPGYDARLEGVRFKSSSQFIRVIDDYARYLGSDGMLFRDIEFRSETFISSYQIKQQFYS